MGEEHMRPIQFEVDEMPQADTVDAAGNFTVTLFRISEQSSIPVMDLLNQLQGLTQP
jgi:hypothetical protein